MPIDPPTVDSLDLLPQRQLNIASLVPAVLWQPFFQDNHEALAIGTFESFEGLIVQMRIYGPSDRRVLEELAVNTPSVMAVAYNTLYAYLISALTSSNALITDMSMHHLTAVFPMHDRERAGKVLHALIGLEQAVENLKGKTPPGYPDIHWNVSAGVSFGTINTAILGSEFLGRKILLIGGDAKIQAEDALDLTRRAQIVVHREVLKQLATAPEGEWLNDQYFLAANSFRATNLGEVIDAAKFVSPPPKPPTGLVQTHRLAAFLDPRIRIRPPFIPLQKGLYTTQLTCLSLRLNGMSLPHGALADRWQQVLQNVFDVATRFGGLINSVVTELGVGEIIISFGVPEDQEFRERRAARCALTLNRILSALDLTIQIGIASGKGFAALLGTRHYSSYVVISPAIEQARLLAARAESREILSDASIQAQTSDLFTWREQPTPHGSDNIYALAGEVSLGSGLKIRNQVTRDQIIVGRHEERAALQEHVSRAIGGDGHLLIIGGESGSGRSTLIDILIGQWLAAQGNGFVSLGPTYSPSAPYSLWVPIWQSIFDLRLDETVRQKQRKLSQAFSRILPDADGGVAIFSYLMGITEREDFSLIYLPAEVRMRRIYDATFTMLKQLSEMSPLLLIFEHTEYSDEHSLKLIKDLSQGLKNKPVLFCLEDRRSPSHTLTRNFDNAEMVEANLLTGAEAWRLFDKHFAKVELPYSYQNVLEKRFGKRSDHEKREHAPTKIASLINVLKHSFLTEHDSVWKGNEQLNAQNIPEDAPEAIAWLLLNVFKPGERETAIRAAATGISFPHHANWLAGQHTDGAGDIDRIEKLGLAQRYLDSGLLERWSRFRHEELRETLYSQLDAKTRVELHEALIKWYHTYFPGPASAAVIAAHAERAGKTIEAVQAYLDAASFAASWGATSTAMQHLLAAERHLAREKEKAPELMLNVSLTRAALYRSQGQVQEGIEQSELSLQHAYDAGSIEAKARALLSRATFAHIEEDYQTLLATTTAAYRFVQQTDDKVLRTEATWLYSKALMATGQRRQAVKLLLEAVQETSSDIHLEMRLDIARIFLMDHYREQANEHVKRLEEQVDELDNPVMVQQIKHLSGQMHLLYGNIQAALHALERALTLPPPPNVGMSALADVLVNHAVALCYAGRYMDAESVFNAARDYYLEDGHDVRANLVNLIQAYEHHLDRGQLDTAESILETIDDLDDPVLDTADVKILKELVSVGIATRRDAYLEAEAHLDILDAMNDSSAKRWYQPVILLRRAELCRLRENFSEASRHAYASLGAVGIQGDLRYLAPAYTLLAEIMILQGYHDEEKIHDSLRRAVKSGRRHGRRLHLANALFLMGHHLHETSMRFRTRALGSSSLFEAEEIFKEMGLEKPTRMAMYPLQKANLDISG